MVRWWHFLCSSFARVLLHFFNTHNYFKTIFVVRRKFFFFLFLISFDFLARFRFSYENFPMVWKKIEILNEMNTLCVISISHYFTLYVSFFMVSFFRLNTKNIFSRIGMFNFELWKKNKNKNTQQNKNVFV